MATTNKTIRVRAIYNNLYHNEYFNDFSGQVIEKKGSHSNVWLIIKSEKLNGNKTHDATVHNLHLDKNI